LNFATTLPKAYTQDDLRIGYMLALQLASAIRNADHVQKMNHAQAELRIYNNELQASNRELDAYNYTIAHDLKSPLTAIGLNADLVQRSMKENLPPKVGKYLDGIKASSHKMADMIDQLLWLARSRNSNDTLTLVEVKPRVEAAIQRFQHALEDHHISATIEGDIPMALGHGQWVEEVFANLISNAIKYMGKNAANPSITIRAISDDHFVRYEVTDTGIGIKEEDQKRLFEMFTRLNTVQADGIGLGLSIVARMVGGMGGMAGIDSIPDKGSTFWFMLQTPK
ncbi:MAG: HAMP domain-containing histidine kinase, partial [Anaerolineae bacterium]|nr:HAMP domain-containing histidine kinase [Anaerolineae bacterium]